jgi:hypothetical protein
MLAYEVDILPIKLIKYLSQSIFYMFSPEPLGEFKIFVSDFHYHIITSSTYYYMFIRFIFEVSRSKIFVIFEGRLELKYQLYNGIIYWSTRIIVCAETVTYHNFNTFLYNPTRLFWEFYQNSFTGWKEGVETAAWKLECPCFALGHPCNLMVLSIYSYN